MNDNGLHKIIFYSELQQGTRSCGGQKKSFKACLKVNIKKCGIKPNYLKDLTADRLRIWALCKVSLQQFEDHWIQCVEQKRIQRRSRTTPDDADFQCDICGRGSDCTHTAALICRDRQLSPQLSAY